MLNKILLDDFQDISKEILSIDGISGSTFLITGANGMLPAYMVESLLFLNSKYQTNNRVIAIVRNIEKANIRFASYSNREDLKIIGHDICYPLILVDRIDYIIHAASQASPKFYKSDPVGTLSANVLGTHHLLRLSEEKKVKSFLFFSSGEVYGDHLESISGLLKENQIGSIDPIELRSCYGESKKMGENMCVSWLNQHEVPTKIVRPFHVYGPGMQLDDGRVFADFVKDVLTNQDILLKSRGTGRRAFCYISDAIVAFFKVLLEGNNGEAYNIGNPNQSVTIYELAKIMVNLIPEKRLKVVFRKPLLEDSTPSNLPCIDKVKDLGWFPKVSIRDGFSRTIKYYVNDK